jgi:hypothetical protein
LEGEAMGGVFNGLRRKAGCATLVIACVFIGVWIRSQGIIDQINLNLGKHALLEVRSADQSITCQYQGNLSFELTGRPLEYADAPAAEQAAITKNAVEVSSFRLTCLLN